MVQKDNLDEIEKCLKDSETLAAEVSTALEDITKGDISDIIKGVTEMAAIAM